MRGKIYGLLELAMPLGYLAGLILATLLGGVVGWRGVFYITGSLGLVLAVVIFFGVKEAPRGRSEPELADLEHVSVYRFDKRIALALFRKRSLLLLFAQGFIGVFPWNVITYWFFRYLETERGYSATAVLTTMGPAIIVLASGYFVGGFLGDYFFKRTPRGRVLVSMVGVLMGAILFFFTMRVPVENHGLFLVMMISTALFIPFAAPNVISTVYDITLPEVRSTALSIESLIENGGAALAPLMAGYLATKSSLGQAILVICVIAWLIGSVFLAFTAYLVPHDIAALREQLRERADKERGMNAPQSTESTP